MKVRTKLLMLIAYVHDSHISFCRNHINAAQRRIVKCQTFSIVSSDFKFEFPCDLKGNECEKNPFKFAFT